MNNGSIKDERYHEDNNPGSNEGNVLNIYRRGITYDTGRFVTILYL